MFSFLSNLVFKSCYNPVCSATLMFEATMGPEHIKWKESPSKLAARQSKQSSAIMWLTAIMCYNVWKRVWIIILCSWIEGIEDFWLKSIRPLTQYEAWVHDLSILCVSIIQVFFCVFCIIMIILNVVLSKSMAVIFQVLVYRYNQLVYVVNLAVMHSIQ